MAPRFFALDQQRALVAARSDAARPRPDDPAPGDRLPRRSACATTVADWDGDAILLIAALSYLGLGVPPPATNWGNMLSDGVNYTFAGYWWLIYPPGILIVLTVVAFNVIGDALRDAFEVRLQTR